VSGNKIIALHPLTIDLELKFFLNFQGYSLNDVLPENTHIPVKRVVNQNACDENESVKTIVHPSIIEMGSLVARLLNVQLAGIDIITTNITKPLAETNGIIMN